MSNSKWVTLRFISLETAAGFVNALPGGIASDHNKVRVGVNGTISMERSLYDELRSEYGPDRFSYTLHKW